jgi:hypothetical protein
LFKQLFTFIKACCSTVSWLKDKHLSLNKRFLSQIVFFICEVLQICCHILSVKFGLYLFNHIWARLTVTVAIIFCNGLANKRIGKPTPMSQKIYKIVNGTAHIRHQCWKTAVLSRHRYLFNSGVEKNEQHLNMD